MAWLGAALPEYPKEGLIKLGKEEVAICSTSLDSAWLQGVGAAFVGKIKFISPVQCPFRTGYVICQYDSIGDQGTLPEIEQGICSVCFPL